jgi:hypothetical protein
MYTENILQWSKKNVYVGIVLNKFPIIRYIFDVLRKIIEDLNAHVIYSPLVYNKISYGLIKITEFSCTLIL